MDEVKVDITKNNSSSTKMLRAMVGIGVLCAFLIVITYQSTQSRIAELKQQSLEEAIFKVLPGTFKTQAFSFKGETFVKTDDKADAQVIYAGYTENGELTGLAVPTAGQGYADIIRILYGYDPEKGVIIGMVVLESKETPGLGDKIEKDAKFKANFDALEAGLNEEKNGLSHEIRTVKNGAKENPWEIDGITGATISSRAIGNMINQSTQEWIPRIQNSIEDFKKE